MTHILWAEQNDRVKHKGHPLLGYKVGWGVGKVHNV